MIRPACAALLLSALPATAGVEVLTFRYLCERGAEVPVAYVNAADGAAVVLTVEGRQIALVQGPSGSGARYEWPGGGSGYVWWSKGAGAMLLWHDGASGEDQTIYADCRSQE
ncbi:MAG: MliC family protein [Rhodobacteraceae bacterium]|mgnify:FL=1|nr:MliC family protein [Paracoccaceae bacterium]MCC0046287.1 MliC family protein [Defluviimonas sp.]MCP5323756.1 MliC family protein [Paracoccaceae bacterium]MCP5377038.1 MliC family protein [Paracoccaceae bacterium]